MSDRGERTRTVFAVSTKAELLHVTAGRWAPKELLQVAGCISRFARRLTLLLSSEVALFMSRRL